MPDQASCVLKLAKFIRLGGLGLILLITLAFLNGCSNGLFTTFLQGEGERTQAAPPDNNNPDNNSGNFTDDNMGGNGNSTDDNMGGDDEYPALNCSPFSIDAQRAATDRILLELPPF
ncbi:MAG: hypothetical protein HAW61_05550 [Candidatus Portiera sp.]|nr:hypothetical protein [Portiera sp.]